MAAKDGQGSTIVFATSLYAGRIIDIDGPDLSRGTIETSHMGTAGLKTYIPTELVEGGSLSVTIELDAASDTPGIGAVAETITVTFGGAGGPVWAFSGFVTGWKPSASMGERMTGVLEIKVADDITYS